MAMAVTRAASAKTQPANPGGKSSRAGNPVFPTRYHASKHGKRRPHPPNRQTFIGPWFHAFQASVFAKKYAGTSGPHRYKESSGG
ncbi:hypothetical protein FHX59_000660 [Paraburkholderia silvatlantica]|uniref:Uncharacterized protein n=1 Tax=Paraburkholderia silvatlantica TaxID=321895 RepID=A0ABR6FFQ3_9BURK|nr:hypothetical protein [Paraburkholderia silvatlantica]PVY26805.1 hypothetical protein C7411_12279 [Paraburkholderia silvatlantica]PXW33092.1 hypothetical protein C7413_12179 [Paraburkholderia silvatlantica]